MTDRPKIPRHQRERIFQRSEGICQKCRCPIDIDTFHVSHLRAHINGGAPVDENLEAWCSRCNLTQGPVDVCDTRWTPREWQLEALDLIVRRITNDGVATVSAAPGAGKTVFAGLVFEALRDNGVLDRMGVLVPRKTLMEQWAGSLAASRHIQLKSGRAVERPGQHGVVTCYQSLTPESVEIHQVQAAHTDTLIVLDEVHHVGERKSWARAVEQLVGTVNGELNVRGVLNMTGTLWREKRRANRSPVISKISTVRYIDLGDGGSQPETDYAIHAEKLIRDRQLRPVDIYRLNARVKITDRVGLTVSESDIADLDDEFESAAVMGELPKCEDYRVAFVSAVLDRLEVAHRSLDHHFKALIVAPRQEEARMFRDEVDRQMTARGLIPLAELAISDEDDAVHVLDKFRRSKRVGVLCTCDMAGEGYDCPDIAVIGFASNKLTKLYVHQVVARAMRVTKVEAKRDIIIPAAVVVPDVPILIKHLIKYLELYNPQINEWPPPPPPPPPPQRCFVCEHERSAHVDDGPCGQCNCPRFVPKIREPRFTDIEIEPTDENVTVGDGLGEILGHFPRGEVDLFGELMESVQLRAVDAPRTMVVFKKYREARPFDDTPDIDQRISDATKRRMTIEEQARQLQKRLHKLEGWWQYSAGQQEMSIAAFVATVNEAAGIANGGREQATPEQLAAAIDHAQLLIGQLCARTGKRPPKTTKGDN